MPQVEVAGGITIGTAGHVDHGKTTLIRAMTGIDTDRLKEERERGLTIDLGFAHLKLPSGLIVGIVDVPGHERFLKNMLAGAGGIDVALLVIAADEGVMPQTKEHVAILQLLRTKIGVVALTKCDMVEPEWIELVQSDISTYLSKTFLADAPIVHVSGTTREGIPELMSELDKAAGNAQRKRTDGPFRMPVDRVFTVTGFGTVVTGTVASGTARIGEAVSLLPGRMQSRIRGIQIHNNRADAASAGTRAAINLAGIDHSDVERGFVVLTPGYLGETQCFDAHIDVLKDSLKGISPRTRVRVHTGTIEVLGRAYPLGTESILPGESGFVQIRTESTLVVGRGDRFVLRLYSPAALLGGGEILEPSAVKHRRNDISILQKLNRALSGEPGYVIEDILTEYPAGISKEELVKKTGFTIIQVDTALEEMVSSGSVFVHSKRIIKRSSYAGAAEATESLLQAYHSKFPARSGMPREELRAQLGIRWDTKSFQIFTDIMQKESRIRMWEDRIALADHSPTLTVQQQQCALQLLQALKSAGINPPSEDEIISILGDSASEILGMLVETGQIVRISEGILFHPEIVENIKSELITYLQINSQITVAEFRNLISSSRKFAVPLLEYFDSTKVTRRKGDVRIIY